MRQRAEHVEPRAQDGGVDARQATDPTGKRCARFASAMRRRQRWAAALCAPDPFVRWDNRGSSMMVTHSCASQLVVIPGW